MDERLYSIDDRSTSCKNLVNFGPVVPKSPERWARGISSGRTLHFLPSSNSEVYEAQLSTAGIEQSG